VPLDEVPVAPATLERFRGVVGPDQFAALERAADDARQVLAGRILWTVNSTARGGGVAEMLQVLMSYVVGAGVDGRWAVIRGDDDFFATTKRLHNWLHGSAGDGGPLGEAEQQHYAERSAMNAQALLECGVRANDIVLLHDPQTAGMIDHLRDAGALVVWRCHIGTDRPDERVAAGWEFLRPFLGAAHRCVFTREAFVPSWMDRDLVSIIPPSIDPFSPKNHDMTREETLAVLTSVGFLESEGDRPARFTRPDGRTAPVRSRVRVIRGEAPIPASVPVVLQVSRWDHLKDMEGVMRGFTLHDRGSDAVLALVGPEVSRVADDPEGRAVLDECAAAWDALGDDDQRRVLLVSVPMDDVDENAVIINALQRHATIVVQKSLAEGFGLTVTEAMWKARPIVTTAVGGISDQIVDGRNGLLLSDPHDLAAFARALDRLLGDPAEAARLAAAARRDVIDHLLGDRHLVRWVELLRAVVA
jgi:trehalose synthase